MLNYSGGSSASATHRPSDSHRYSWYMSNRSSDLRKASADKQEAQARRLLLLSADHDFVRDIDSHLCLQGFEILKAESQAGALGLIEKEMPDIVFIDIERMPAQEMDLVNYINTRSPRTEIVILTTIHDVERATQSLRHGASFYLLKPVDCSQIKTVVQKLSARLDRSSEFSDLEQRVLSDLMIGSPAMQKVLKLTTKIAPTTSTVLIEGESGTGKEFFARIMHRLSQRLDGRFIAMNCGAIPEALFESELFGHSKGAFTGADRDKPGLVEEAHMGTLFLDEVGELSPAAQVKLLRFLQERSYRRVGDPKQQTVNVRIIAATNNNLTNLVAQGTFRKDLFYRLNVFLLSLPPLRERKETIPNLIRLFVHRNNQLLDKSLDRISQAAELLLAEYDYPGNVRELENIIEHAVVLAEGTEITERDLPEFIFQDRLMLSAPVTGGHALSGQQATGHSGMTIMPLAEVEKLHIERVLQALDQNYSEAAKRLGISRSTLWRKIKAYRPGKVR